MLLWSDLLACSKAMLVSYFFQFVSQLSQTVCGVGFLRFTKNLSARCVWKSAHEGGRVLATFAATHSRDEWQGGRQEENVLGRDIASALGTVQECPLI